MRAPASTVGSERQKPLLSLASDSLLSWRQCTTSDVGGVCDEMLGARAGPVLGQGRASARPGPGQSMLASTSENQSSVLYMLRFKLIPQEGVSLTSLLDCRKKVFICRWARI